MDDEIERLFRERPRTEEELLARLSVLPAAATRSALIARLASSGASPREVPIYVRAFAMLEASSEDLPALSALVTETAAPVEGRAVALALVRSVEPVHAQRLAQSITQAELIAMNDAQLVVVIAGIAATPFRISEISDKIARQPSGSRSLRFAQIERIRVRLGVPAALLYADLARRDDLGLGNAVVDLIVEEGGAAAGWLCETLWQGTISKAPRAYWAEVLARVYRSMGRAPTKGLRGEAYLGSVDEAGAAVALLSVTSPVDASLTLSWLRIGEGNTILSGGVKTLGDERDRDEALALCGPSMPKEPSLPAPIASAMEAPIRKMKSPTTAVLEIFAAACYFSMATHL